MDAVGSVFPDQAGLAQSTFLRLLTHSSGYWRGTARAHLARPVAQTSVRAGLFTSFSLAVDERLLSFWRERLVRGLMPLWK